MNDRKIWDANSFYWDKTMEEGNSFYKKLILPGIKELLDLKNSHRVLDIACGNGVFSRYLSDKVSEIVAFDFSGEMIKIAKKRTPKEIKNIEKSQLFAVYKNLFPLVTAIAKIDKIFSPFAKGHTIVIKARKK